MQDKIIIIRRKREKSEEKREGATKEHQGSRQGSRFDLSVFSGCFFFRSYFRAKIRGFLLAQSSILVLPHRGWIGWCFFFFCCCFILFCSLSLWCWTLRESLLWWDMLLRTSILASSRKDCLRDRTTLLSAFLGWALQRFLSWFSSVGGLLLLLKAYYLFVCVAYLLLLIFLLR